MPLRSRRARRLLDRRARPAPWRAAVRYLVWGGGAGVVAFWYATVALPVLPDPAPADVVAGLGRLSGLLASYLVCALFVAVSRAPFVERAYGLDVLVACHRRLGSTAVLLIVVHVVLAITGRALREATAVWAQVPGVLAEPGLLEAYAGTVLVVGAGVVSMRWIRRRLSYEVWLAVHLTTYAGIYLAFWHQILAGSQFAGAPVASVVWTAMHVVSGAVLLTWRVGRPLVMLARHRFRVEAVVAESPRATSVWLRGRAVERLGTRSGQFYLVRFLARGHAVTAHPYSVSALCPREGLIRFTVGALGDHSGAVGALRPGTPVLLEGPFGLFTAARARTRAVLLVAGGAGIGPVRALAEEFSLEGRDVVVVHRASTVEDLALGKELLAGLGARYVPVVGRRTELGRDPLDEAGLLAAVPDVARREVFLCGPPGMVRSTVRTCRRLGVRRRDLHHERLSIG